MPKLDTYFAVTPPPPYAPTRKIAIIRYPHLFAYVIYGWAHVA